MLNKLPSVTEMYHALCQRDRQYEGVFFAGVKTTGIFCRPSCAAKKPKAKNIEYFPNTLYALAAGYRPCNRCQPLLQDGQPPDWLAPLLLQVEQDPATPWTNTELQQAGFSPNRVREWFKRQHNMTFQTYLRLRRLGLAIRHIQLGDSISRAALDAGFAAESTFREAFHQWFGHPPRELEKTRLIWFNRIPSTLGPLFAAAADDGLCLLEFCDRRMLQTQLKRLRQRLNCVFLPGEHPQLRLTQQAVLDYFAGNQLTLPSLHSPGTDFQQTVWTALQTVPPGQTISYRDLAHRIGQPSAVRAVARANGDNRIAIFIPCHRMVGSDGKLRGYGGGLWRKQFLLDLETQQHQVKAG